MKIFFAIPAYRGIQSLPFLDSLEASVAMLRKQGYDVTVSILSECCYVQVARNELVRSFRMMDDPSPDDVMVWVDDDLSWKPEDILPFIQSADEITAGVYPYKTPEENYPVVIHAHEDGRPKVRADGWISAACVATGFLFVKRSAIDRMCDSYNSQKYFKRKDGEIVDGYYDLFPQGLRDGQWVGEDFAFCRLWTDIGGAIWIQPNVNLSHWKGDQEFKGNYHQFLLRQPGGSEAKNEETAFTPVAV